MKKVWLVERLDCHEIMAVSGSRRRAADALVEEITVLAAFFAMTNAHERALLERVGTELGRWLEGDTPEHEPIIITVTANDFGDPAFGESRWLVWPQYLL